MGMGDAQRVLTLNGDPKGLTPALYNGRVGSAEPLLRGCFESDPGSVSRVTARFKILPNGRVVGTEVGGGAGTRTASCVRQVVEGLRFPEFQGPAVQQELPLDWSPGAGRP
jgi:hypothetical protein